MGPLIYTVGIGEYFRGLATLLVDSLRTMGEYRGDIIVFSDSNEPIPGADVRRYETRVHPVVTKLELWTEIVMMGRRPSILYLDADILACRNVSQLLDPPSDGFRVFRNGLLTHMYYREHLPRWVKRKWGATRGINGGAFLASFDGFARWAPVWYEQYLRGPGKNRDQSAINALWTTGYMPTDDFPPEWCYFWNVNPIKETTPRSSETIIEHFYHGKRKLYMPTRLRELKEIYAQNTNEALCCQGSP